MGHGNESTVMSQHLATLPGCEYLPNEPAVETIWQLFIWLFICCTCTCALVKDICCGNMA